MIRKETIEQIIETARIEEVVGEYVSLKKRGINLIGRCPFHNEKTPSFTVSPAKGIFKCFGCGKAGNSVNFIMEHEHLTYPEALKALARKYQIHIEEEEQSQHMKEVESLREALFLVNQFALSYYNNILHNTDTGKAIGYSYFKERGFSDEIIKKFQLGYSTGEWEGLTKAALANGYKLEYLVKTGLTVAKETKRFDLFRDRVIFPIFSLSGRVVAFTSRTLLKDKTVPKYVNSPECDIFQKRAVLYGMHLAKKAIIQNDNCYLVEGNTDVISMHQAGVENVVASSGTSLTIEQIKLIHRFTNNITILYDGDAAGIKASFRGIDMILEEGLNVRVVLFPDGEDPDSYCSKHSASEVSAFIAANTRDFIDFKTSILLEDAKNDPIKKAELIRDIVRSIALIPEPIVLSDRSKSFIAKCSSELKIDEQTLYMEFNKARASKLKQKEKEKDNDHRFPQEEYSGFDGADLPPLPDDMEEAMQIRSACESQEKDLIRILLNYGDQLLEVEVLNDDNETEFQQVPLAQIMLQELNSDVPIKLDNVNYQRILDEYNEVMSQGDVPQMSYFSNNQDPQISKTAIDLITISHHVSDNWKIKQNINIYGEKDRLLQASEEAITKLKIKKIDEILNELQNKMRNVTSEEELQKIMEEYMLYKTFVREIEGGYGRVIIK